MDEIINNIEKKYKDYKRKFNKDLNYFLNDFNKIKNHLENYKNKYNNDKYNIIYHTYYIKYIIKYNLFKDINNKEIFKEEKYKKIINNEFNNLKNYYNKYSYDKKKLFKNSLKNFKVRDGIHKSFINYCINSL